MGRDAGFPLACVIGMWLFPGSGRHVKWQSRGQLHTTSCTWPSTVVTIDSFSGTCQTSQTPPLLCTPVSWYLLRRQGNIHSSNHSHSCRSYHRHPNLQLQPPSVPPFDVKHPIYIVIAFELNQALGACIFHKRSRDPLSTEMPSICY